MGFPGGSAGKESACNAGDLGSIPGLGRSHGEGNGYPLQYSGLENSMDYTILHGVAKSWTRLSNFGLPWCSDGQVSVYNAGGLVRSLGWEDPLEREMATRSGTLAWKILWTEEPGRLHTAHGVAKVPRS